MRINRLQKLRPAIAERDLDALLVSLPENCRYLSGFTGSSAWLFISDKHAILATDFRYIEQAKDETQSFEVAQIKGELFKWLPALVSDLGWQKLGFEADYVSFTAYHKLSEAIKTRQLNLELVPTIGLVEQLRSVKEPVELELIAKAVELSDAAFEQAKSLVRLSMTEKELAWEIEKFLRGKGSEGVPFEIIVASGPNSALPHARPTERAIQLSEPVLIDMGAKAGGYCSDFSRTLCLGRADTVLQEIYDIVLRAQLTAIEGIKTGMSTVEADGLARSIIKQAGYGDKFGHGLGHGVGLAVHEFPTLSPESTGVLVDNMVFTIEPGIYLPGWGGVRIEDVVTLKEGRTEVLSKAGKEFFHD